MAVQMLYQYELGGSSLAEIFADYDAEDCLRESELALAAEAESQAPAEATTPTSRTGRKRGRKHPDLKASLAYARQLVEGTAGHSDEIDGRIRRFTENWRLERMSAIDRNILRLAIYEMYYEQKVPKIVILDEAIELAKRFGSEHSSRFVNGLLDAVLNATDAPVAAATDAPDADP